MALGMNITPNTLIGYNEKTDYVHKDGPVMINQGIGRGSGPWGAFIQKPNGSLKRFKSIEMCPDPTMVKLLLDSYKGKTIWKVKP
jgi:hypothetical protein